MREADYIFEDGLLKGLKRFKTSARGEQTLIECHNWMPAEQGLETHEEIKTISIGTTYDQTP